MAMVDRPEGWMGGGSDGIVVDMSACMDTEYVTEVLYHEWKTFTMLLIFMTLIG